MNREATSFMAANHQSLTSLSRDQLIHVVRSHEQRESFTRCSDTSPRVPKKAKYDDTDDNDDLEGFLAKAKAEYGVAASKHDLASPLRTKDDDIVISASSASPWSWSKRPSRSFRSFASSCGGSTAAELDCLASIATPPGLLRNATNSSFVRPGNPQLAMMEEEDDDYPTDYDFKTSKLSC